MTTSLEKSAALPKGFTAAGLHCGIKKDKKDIALLYSEQPASVAGVFTTNQIKAAPVKLGMETLKSGKAQAILCNSGNANACTGEQGMANAKSMATLTAAQLGLDHSEVFVCSTGTIGKQLSMDKVEGGIAQVVQALSNQGSYDVADAILTTDLVPKFCSTTLTVNGQTITLTGIAKGSGMIEPNMATMLSFVMTDAAIASSALQDALSHANQNSFNRIVVDGDMSTNDTVLMLANGASNITLDPSHTAWPEFQNALNALCKELAFQIVRDGEGVTHFITLKVGGMPTTSEAEILARKIARSYLVKTGWAGTYPVWGRIMDVLGYAGPTIIEEKINIWFDDKPIVKDGLHTEISTEESAEVTLQEEYTVTINMGLGNSAVELYTCDITEEYVRINL